MPLQTMLLYNMHLVLLCFCLATCTFTLLLLFTTYSGLWSHCCLANMKRVIMTLCISTTKLYSNAPTTQCCIYSCCFFKATIYHSILQQVRQHHHNSTLSVVNKLPHVPSGGLHGTLSYDVRLLLLITLQKADEYYVSSGFEMYSSD